MNGSAISTGFRSFRAPDTPACLAIFDLNCPAFFAPGERADYAAFLSGADATYEVCLSGVLAHGWGAGMHRHDMVLDV